MLTALTLIGSADALQFGDPSSDHLFATLDDDLIAIDAKGDVTWRATLATMDGRSLGAPLLTSGTVVVGDGTRIHAVDAGTGKSLWTAHYPLSENSTEGLSSQPVEHDGVLLSTKSWGLVGLDLKTGKERWAQPYSNGFSPPTPLGDGTALTIHETGNHELWRVKISTGEVLSKTPIPGSDGPRPDHETHHQGVVTPKGVAFCTAKGLLITAPDGSNPKTVKVPMAMFGCAPEATSDRIAVHSGTAVTAYDWNGGLQWTLEADRHG